MSTKIITEIVESLKENFDENALQIIERTLYKALTIYRTAFRGIEGIW